MKQIYNLIVLFIVTTLSVNAQESGSIVDLVNPLVGTQSNHSLSNGNTYPAIAVPWGMNFWTPQTGEMGNGWQYSYTADKIRGFKQTHQPSPWINDYGQFVIMPTTGTPEFDQDKRASWFSHKTEEAKPNQYSVYLADHDVRVSFATTERGAIFKMIFPETEHSYITVDALDKGSYIKVIPEENKIIGYTTKNSGGVPENFKNYFVIYSDKDIEFKKIFRNGAWKEFALESQANHVGAVIGFKTSKGEEVNLKVASSFISFEQAELNLEREIANKDFDQVAQEGHDQWEKALSRIEVKGGTDSELETFYSCLYRSLLFPRKFYELDSSNEVVHYSPYNGEVLPGYMYVDTGFWDTFRSLFPFLNLMYPSQNSEMQAGLVNSYKESGFLPEWSSPGHRNCMIGSNSTSVVADAYLKGLKGYDIETLYEAALKNTTHEGPLTSVGRRGCDYYNDLGYVPYDVGINENAARTLEYAYADWALYKLGEELGRPKKELETLAKRSQNYKNLFSEEHKLMRGKNEDGTFQSPFNPLKWGDAFTEGNSWHYSWSVFHDIEGLIGLMGGDDEFTTMLDSVFSVPPHFDESYYGSIIHEIREMQIAGMGNYAHGNQPIQHMIYLYNYAAEPWKSQYWVRETMDKLYSPTPDGYCGDEDNGQTSAWYVFSAMGFYPVCPGSDEYVIGSPLFSEITLNLENGNKVNISAKNNSKQNRYIDDIKINSVEYTKNFLSHKELMKGQNIDIEMSSRPNLKRGTAETDKPYSFSNEKR